MSIKILLSVIAVISTTFQTAKAQSSALKSDTLTTIIGKWSGTYAGDASGKFELVINQDNTRKLTGQVIMLTDNNERHSIDLKTISWKNGQLKATYIDPSEDDEVTITGSYTNPDLEGTWKSDEGQSTGTWQLTPTNG